MRLRRLDFWAARMVVSLRYSDGWPKWKETVYLGRCQDTPSLLKAFERAWGRRPLAASPFAVGPSGPRPFQASITLIDLTPGASTTPSLFVEERRALAAAKAMDAANEKFGPNTLYFASMHETRDSAPMRIAFTSIPDLPAEMNAREASPLRRPE